MLTGGQDGERLARSILDWWRLAGVEWDYADTPTDWLTGDAEREQPRGVPKSPPDASAQARPAASRQAVSAPAAEPVALPDTLDAFHALWCAGGLGADGGIGPWVGPLGKPEAAIMVMTGSPEPDDRDHVLSGAAGRLLGNILKVCLADPGDSYRASFYPRRVLDMREAARHAGHWRQIALHHVALVRPKMLVVAGKDTARALLGHDLSQKLPVSHFLNHGGRTTKMVVTRHLNLMLHRSAAEKAEAWKIWQRLLVE